jgi:hypothetical protein
MVPLSHTHSSTHSAHADSADTTVEEEEFESDGTGSSPSNSQVEVGNLACGAAS